MAAAMRSVELDLATHQLSFSDTRPRPCIRGNKDVLIRVLACGICGTDLHLIKGGLDKILSPKTTLGHEAVGTVAEVGPAVKDVKVGQFVALQPMGRCFRCVCCNSGNFNLCKDSISAHLGYTDQGGWADYCVVHDHQAYPIPCEDIPSEIAVLAEPVGGVLNGWRQLGGQLTMEKCILILGGGLIGTLWAAILSFRGFRNVWISEPSESRRQQLSVWPGVTAVSPHELESRLEDSVDILIECCAVADALKKAIKCLSDGATVLVFGIYEPGQYLALDLHNVMFKEWSFVSALGNNHTFREAVALVSRMFSEGVLTSEKIGIRGYGLEEYAEALKALSEKTVTKAVLKTQ